MRVEPVAQAVFKACGYPFDGFARKERWEMWRERTHRCITIPVDGFTERDTVKGTKQDIDFLPFSAVASQILFSFILFDETSLMLPSLFLSL